MFSRCDLNEPDTGVTGCYGLPLCSVILGALPLHRAPAAAAAAHRERASPCGLNKEGKKQEEHKKIQISWWWKDMQLFLERTPVWFPPLSAVQVSGGSGPPLGSSALCQPVHTRRDPGGFEGFVSEWSGSTGDGLCASNPLMTRDRRNKSGCFCRTCAAPVYSQLGCHHLLSGARSGWCCGSRWSHRGFNDRFHPPVNEHLSSRGRGHLAAGINSPFAYKGIIKLTLFYYLSQ